MKSVFIYLIIKAKERVVGENLANKSALVWQRINENVGRKLAPMKI